MYLGSWKIDDLLTFTVNTHRFDTGNATDADSVPSYRVYEDETGTPLLTGNMALLDDANTTGQYSEQITLSAANGFEKGKSYNIRISATVNSVTGCTVRSFQMEAEVDANVVSDKTGYTASTVSDKTGYSIASGGITAAAIATGAIDADALAADAGAEIADAVWDEVMSGHTTAGTAGDALSDAGAAGDPWSAAVRTLTSSAAETTAAVSGSDLVIHRGDYWSASLTGLGSIASRTKLWFTVKRDKNDLDSEAILQIEETAGLTILNGATYATPTDGDITVNDAALGNITITLNDDAAALLSPANKLYYDVQQLTATGADTLTYADLKVSADVTRAVS